MAGQSGEILRLVYKNFVLLEKHPSPGKSGSNEVKTRTPTSVQDDNITYLRYISGNLFFAERAIEHAKKNEDEILSIFAGLGIASDSYTISAGFNELLIGEGVTNATSGISMIWQWIGFTNSVPKGHGQSLSLLMTAASEKPKPGNSAMRGSNSAGGSPSASESSGQGAGPPSDPSGSGNAGDNDNKDEDEDGGDGITWNLQH
ncbi:hypothetical protein BDQ17DRAFT_1334658 [Cyathus striatus]|nr:hypothetical protein BDQ17DRAFT_1334658 [Cyathus striatus]